MKVTTRFRLKLGLLATVLVVLLDSDAADANTNAIVSELGSKGSVQVTVFSGAVGCTSFGNDGKVRVMFSTKPGARFGESIAVRDLKSCLIARSPKGQSTCMSGAIRLESSSGSGGYAGYFDVAGGDGSKAEGKFLSVICPRPTL